MNVLGLPDLGTLLALLLAAASAAVVWLVRLWQGAKERERQTQQRLNAEVEFRAREKRILQTLHKTEAEAAKREAEVVKEVKEGRRDHQESQPW